MSKENCVLLYLSRKFINGLWEFIQILLFFGFIIGTMNLLLVGFNWIVSQSPSYWDILPNTLIGLFLILLIKIIAGGVSKEVKNAKESCK